MLNDCFTIDGSSPMSPATSTSARRVQKKLSVRALRRKQLKTALRVCLNKCPSSEADGVTRLGKVKSHC